MANNHDRDLPEIDRNGLYREDAFTDRRVGTIQRLTPVNSLGEVDHSRPVIYIGQTQIMTPAGALPLSFDLPGASLDEAAAGFGIAAEKALEETTARIEEMRRKASSSIIVPDKSGPRSGGGFGGLQDI